LGLGLFDTEAALLADCYYSGRTWREPCSLECIAGAVNVGTYR